MDLFRRCWKEESGEDLIEYGLIAVLVSTLVVAALQDCGAVVSGIWNRTNSALNH